MIRAWLLGAMLWAPFSLFAAGMNAPPEPLPQPSPQPLPSLPSWSAQQAVRLFQVVISPADGPRSPSFPTGSAYGMQVLREEGFFWGVLMIGDRLFHEADRPLGPLTEVYGKTRFYDPPLYNKYWRE